MPPRTVPSQYRVVLTSLLCALCVLAPIPVRAQAVINPTTAEFDPSADHGVINNGVPVVGSYQLGFYLLGAAQPFQVTSLGKPALDGDGKIRVVFTGLMGTVPAPGINYEAKVSAIGPGGVSTSAPSNVFSFASSPTCTFGVTPATQSMTASGGSLNASVSVAAVCGWNATSNAGWITITSGSSGTGNGTVSYSVAALTATAARSGTLTIAGQTLTVNQSGACSFTVMPTTQNVPAAGGTATASVTTTSACGWTATSNAGWITVTAGSSGTGNGTVTYSAAANTGASRNGTLTIAGRTLTASQPANGSPAAPSNLRVVTPQN